MATQRSPKPPSTNHPGTHVRLLDGLLLAAGLAAWTGPWWLPPGAHTGAIIVATALTTGALLRPWCRRHTRRTIAGATWASERERQHAASEAGRHAETWRAIVDTATEGIVTIDTTGRIETVNGAAEQMFGYEPRELVGKDVTVLMPPPFAGEHAGYVDRYLRTGQPRIIGIGREVIGLRKDGTQFPIDLSVGKGSIDDRIFFTAVMRDITERQELQAKLAQAERLVGVGELSAGVAHEINNPINTMINCAQLIEDGDDSDEYSRIIIEEGERIAGIVRALLQFARDDKDVAQPTSLAEVVALTLRLVGESWKRHGITLTVDVPEDLPPVHARPQMMQQVLLNLMLNAKDALVVHDIANRHVSLNAAEAAGGVELLVSDNGPGIEPAVRERIFEPFVTTKRARGGTGLGLSISKGILEGYGGTIRLLDGSPGSVFAVWLPQSPEDQSPTE